MLADVLSRFGYVNEGVISTAPHYDMEDVSLHPPLVEWLRVVVPHLSLEACLTAARAGLRAGHPL